MARKRFSILLVALAAWALAACTAPPAETSTPTRIGEPVATAIQPRATPQPPVTGDDWSRVQAAGVIQVASPLDNSPFNMYNANFKPDGFDVALMNELARRVGLKAKFVDVPFEGLLGALQLGQADAAIGAMAVTKDRQTQADFTQTYYVGEDGILAAPDSDISAIRTRADMAARRVGVVRGTVYESWLNQNLIQTSEMPAANLQVYTRPDDAVRALANGDVDLVVLDREPAQTYAAQGLAKLVGQSQYSQNFAIPVRKGSALLSHLNEALAAALADGTVAGLIEQYLEIDKGHQLPVPTPTPQPAVIPTAAPTPAGTPTPVPCTNGTGYGEPLDLTVPDGTTMQPGQTFEKRWRIVNVGTCDWTTAYSFVYANKGNGGRMGGKDAPIAAAVPIGSSYDVSVAMVAPSTPGTYTSYWEMEDAKGVPFGQQVSVKIQVPAPPTAVPPTSPPPSGLPTIQSFAANPTSIQGGQCTFLSWNVQGQTSRVAVVRNGAPVWDYTSTSASNRQDCPPGGTQTYELQAFGPNGSGPTKAWAVVQVQSSVPNIEYLNADPGSITQGQCTTLSWNVQGQTSRVALVRNGFPLEDGNRANGSKQDCQAPSGTVTYELQAWGPNNSGPAKRQTNVQVQANPPPCQPRTLNATDDNCGQTQNMQICDTFVVTLHVNGGTGYSWTATDYGEPMLSFQGGGDQQCGGGPGAPCEYRWQYHGAESGSTKVRYVLRDPSGNETQECSFPVNVQ
jgi:arginine/lysine/histidine transporter system substrate-binding protein